ncbi:MAG: leucine-rich repeat domain-containing protein [Lachnospiraceae bacterium]|nr:leucine-rich repeat domain-containing protein [Lachnospiraceae bacterium]MBQ9593196.1 leucine-rich repeat domain-containing protein [Lachnospiraceae bacterium]MBR0152913.1 leucine-rich repeat domain-containing protein [Lachnospiraceae bacterium]
MQEFFYRPSDDGTYCVIEYEGDEAEVVIPERYGIYPITVLYDGLFAGHSEITSVTIPDTVTDLGEFLFDGCENLKKVKLPSKLKALWGQTFARSGLEEVWLPNQLESIPPFAFKDCKNLKKVVCGAGMKRIYAWAFAGCDVLDELFFGPGVTMSKQAFESKNLNELPEIEDEESRE